MLHVKDTKFYEFKAYFKGDFSAIGAFSDIFGVFKYKSMTNNIFSYKTKGYNPLNLFWIIILFPFLSIRNVYGFTQSSHKQLFNICKDTFYDLLSSNLVNWRILLLNVVKRFNKLTPSNSKEQGENVKCFIADDTDIEKRGCKFEGISRIFNHVTKSHIFGFKLLTLGLWDGKSFVPVDFSLHNEKGKKKNYGMSVKQRKQRFTKERDKSTPGAKRKKELRLQKTKNLIKMIRRAVKHGLTADYVLTDAWFCTQDIIEQVRQIKGGKLNLISMCRMDKRNYEVNGKEMNASQILKCKKQDKKRSRVNKVYYIEVTATYKGIPVKLFFTRLTKRAKWRLIVTTDTSLSFNNMYKIYQIRWTIEVFFKETKQYLGLGECQSIDFDSQIAATTISYIQYIMLALHKRHNMYESIGGLFEQCKTGMQETIMSERIWGEILEMIHGFIIEFDLPIEIEELLKKLINKINNKSEIKHIFSPYDYEGGKKCA